MKQKCVLVRAVQPKVVFSYVFESLQFRPRRSISGGKAVLLPEGKPEVFFQNGFTGKFGDKEEAIPFEAFDKIIQLVFDLSKYS